MLSFDRARDVEQQNRADQLSGVDSEVIDGLRAALDVERSTTQQLTESLQQQQQRIADLTSELSQLSEQLTAERSLTAQLRSDIDSAVVSHLFCILES